MIRLTMIAALLTLAACGADGPPERPTSDAHMLRGGWVAGG